MPIVTYLMLINGREIPTHYDFEQAWFVIDNARQAGGWLTAQQDDGKEIRIDPHAIVAVRAA